MWFLSRLAVSLGLISYLLSTIDIEEFLDQIAKLAVLDLFTAISIIFFLVFINSFRWKIVLTKVDKKEAYFVLWRLWMIGAFFSQALPSSIGGDAVRIWILSDRGFSISNASASVIVERFSGFMVMIIFSLGAIPILATKVNSIEPLITLSLVVFFGIFILFVLTFLDRLLAPFSRLLDFFSSHHFGRLLLRIIEGIGPLPSHIRRVLFLGKGRVSIFICSLAVQSGHIFMAWFLCLSLSIELSFTDCLIVVTPALLLSAIPISIAGWGVREGAMVVALQFLNVQQELAFTLSIVFGLTLLLSSLPGGFLWLFYRDKIIRKKLTT